MLENLKYILEPILGEKSSLRRQTIFGSNWLIFRSAVQAVADLVKTMIFSRILFPEDYGLMALAMIAFGLLESFSATGLEVKIQSDAECDDTKLNVYWTIKFARGLLLAVLTWFAAFPLAYYYGRPELVYVVRFLSLVFLARGLAGFGREIRQRNMEFKAVAITESIATIAVLISGLVVLLWVKDVWALAAYTVLESVALLVTSFLLHPMRPKIQFSKKIFRGVAVFSGSIIAINVLNYFFTNYDKGIVGKLLGIDMLGYYARAYFLAVMPAFYFANSIMPVILAVLRQAADDDLRLRNLFWKMFAALSSMSLLIGAVAYIFADDVVLFVYGDRWIPVVSFFKILLIFGISKCIVNIFPTLFYVRGKPWLIIIPTLIMVIIFGIICLPLTRLYGLEGTSWSVVVAAIISHVTAFFICFHQLGQSRMRMQASYANTLRRLFKQQYLKRGLLQVNNLLSTIKKNN